ncbi:MAG: ABC transporter permease [Eubacterium sp.]|nr:ABC transporter permease [Eubacterium sp.]
MGYSSLHKDKQKEYNFADVMVNCALEDEDKEKIEEIISNEEGIESYEKYYPVMKQFEMKKTEAEEDSKDMYDLSSYNLLILPYGEWGELEAPHFVELSDEEYENPIYVSYYYNSNLLNAKLGDSVDLKVGDKYYTFQVAGFFESLLSSGTAITYVSPSLYNEWKTEEESNLQSDSDKSRALFYMKLAPGTEVSDVVGDLTKSFGEHEISASALGVDLIIASFTYMQNMIAAMMFAFALVITLISVIIIYFRISNSIEQNIVNIGALKAMGYTSRQIRLGMVIEFMITTASAAIIGIVLSKIVLPIFEYMIRGFSGVTWDSTYTTGAIVITLLIILGAVLIVSFISTRGIGKLDPVVALRYGIDTHSFKKNHAPIEKTAGPLTWIMALKSVLSSAKQSVILFVVMTSIGIVTTFSSFLAYNCVYDPSSLFRMLQLVGSDVTFVFEEDPNAISEISELPDVESVFWTDTVDMTAEGYNVYATITDDWSSISDVNIYEGRAPKYDNEVAAGGAFAKTIDAEIGDEIEVSYGNQNRKYIICGLEQSSSNNGMDISLTEEGAEHLGYEAEKNYYGVFVKNHSLESSERVVETVRAMYGEKITRYGNIVKSLKEGDDTVIAIASLMVGVMVIICLVVIVLSLNLLVKTMIIKKQREIGIKKALGFSSSQLRTELVLSMLPQILIGAVVGSALGSMWSNSMLAGLLSSVGIMKSAMEMFIWMPVVSVIFGVVVSAIIIWILSRRIKRISAYSLITE